MMKYRILLTAVFSFTISDAFSQSDTIYLAGQSRYYRDSVVLRWNAVNASSFAGLLRSSVMIEKQNQEGDAWIKAGSKEAVQLEKWNVTGSEKNQQLLLAAASIQQIQKLTSTPTNDPEEAMKREEDLKFLWMNASLAADLNPRVATLCNLRFTDKNPGKEFPMTYRVYSSSPGFISDTIYFTLSGVQHAKDSLNKPMAIEKERLVEIRWSADKKYSGYYIEKSPKGKNSFVQLNRGPLVIPGNQGENPLLFFNDSVSNYQPADYRIYGIDMFGDKTHYSPLLTAQGRDKTPPPPITGFKVKENPDKTIKLTWDRPEPENGEKGIAIGYKHTSDASYQPAEKRLIPLNQISYTFKTFPNQSDYFFALQIFDTAGNSSISEAFYQMIDNVPPAKPSGLKAVVDKKGIVKITWNWNNEPDLDGYLVYFSNSPKTEFSGIVNRPYYDTVFYDTLSLKMLNRDVYYHIRAADKRFNLSEKSEIVKVLRPDTLPPVTPVIKNYFVTDSTIQLNWIPSSSKDVVTHRLHRKHVKSGKISITPLKVTDTVYHDRNLISEDKYEYYLTAEDDSKNVSPPSNTVSLNTYKNFYKPAVSIVYVQYDSLKKHVVFEWNYNMKNVKKVVIFKGPSIDKVSRLPDAIPGNSLSFTDNRIKKGPVFYAVKMYLQDGTETRLSVPVGVVIP